MSKLAYCPNCHILAVVHRKKCRKCKERIPEEYLRKLKNGNSKENCCGKGLNN
jgi:hypothetical protein